MSGCASDDKEDKAVFGRHDTRVEVDLVHKLSLAVHVTTGSLQQVRIVCTFHPR